MDLNTKIYKEEEENKNDEEKIMEITLKLEKALSTPKLDIQKNFSDNSPKKITINDYLLIKNLGKGSYAKVISAKNIHTGKIYAIKVIDKAFIEREEKVNEVHIERQLLSIFSHPNIVKFYCSFHNSKKLYFVLELAEKGDLKHFIKSQSKNKIF